ncbi:MAG: hypothetical protein IGS03_08430 [Candidatus Sericytochromatia bacterium]|nr:hypothetical protein [Candidatus Sericytochromatia bacterium]
MRNIKTTSLYLLGLSLSSMLLLSACGSGQDLGAGYSTSADLSAALNTNAALPGASNSQRDEEVKQALDTIISGINGIRQDLQTFQRGGGMVAPAPSMPAPGTAAPAPDAPGTSRPPRPQQPSSGGAAPSAPSAPAAPSQPQAPSAAERGQAELDALMNTISSTQFVALTAAKVEKNLDSGKITSNKVKMWSKAPNTVKIDILESTSGSAGVKALYTSGQGSKIKVRPSGALGFVTVDLDKTDDRVASNNGYLSDEIDLFGVHKRLSKGYQAELVGTTQVEGVRVNILKITTTGTNTLDSRIDYEYLGYEPDSYKIRLWEIYAQGEQQPYYRMTMSEIDYPASLPDSTFKL